MTDLQLNFARIFDTVAGVRGAEECIAFRDRSLSWNEVSGRTDDLAQWFSHNGLGASGDPALVPMWESAQNHVALYMHNGNEYLETMIAAFKARCAPINVNYRYQADELVYLLNDSASRVLVYHATFAPLVHAIRSRLDHLQLLVQVSDDSSNQLLDGAHDYEGAISAGGTSGPDLDSADLGGDDLYICYTGGTTGFPKGVLWRQHDFLVSALGMARRDGTAYASYDEICERAGRSALRALPAPPFMHGAAHWNAMSCFAAGGTVIVQDNPSRFDPVDVLRTAERQRATSLLIVGDPFARPLLDEMDRAPYDLSHLTHILSGGAVLSPASKRRLVEHLPQVSVVDVLGSSESGRQGVSQTRSAGRPDPLSDEGTDEPGRFVPSPLAAVLSEDRSRILDPGSAEVGWLAQRGLVPRGYLGDPDKTQATFPLIDGSRFSVAGDRARLDRDGAIVLLGRDSATISTGGEKVFAEEVETAVTTHPAVRDAVVCGRPNERWGQEIIAIVSLSPGSALTLPELREHTKRLLADYKAPRGMVIVEHVLRSPSGKADYRWAAETVEKGPLIHR